MNTLHFVVCMKLKNNNYLILGLKYVLKDKQYKCCEPKTSMLKCFKVFNWAGNQYGLRWTVMEKFRLFSRLLRFAHGYGGSFFRLHHFIFWKLHSKSRRITFCMQHTNTPENTLAHLTHNKKKHQWRYIQKKSKKLSYYGVASNSRFKMRLRDASCVLRRHSLLQRRDALQIVFSGNARFTCTFHKHRKWAIRVDQ